MNLSEHFTLEELCFSQTATRKGIKNEPNDEIIQRLKHLAKQLEFIRNTLNEFPIRISSGFRCLKLNRAIGSVDISAHVLGYAVDFTCREFGTPKQICEKIVAAGYKFDQLINEQDWVHISFDPRMRGDILTAKFSGSRVSYIKGL